MVDCPRNMLCRSPNLTHQPRKRLHQFHETRKQSYENGVEQEPFSVVSFYRLSLVFFSTLMFIQRPILLGALWATALEFQEAKRKKFENFPKRGLYRQSHSQLFLIFSSDSEKGTRYYFLEGLKYTRVPKGKDGYKNSQKCQKHLKLTARINRLPNCCLFSTQLSEG